MRSSSSPVLCALFAGVLAPITGALSACDFAAVAGPVADAPGQGEAPSEVVALAGGDVVVVEGARVALNGAASRALRGAPVLAWTQREGPPVVLSNPSSATPSFRAPLGPARLLFDLEARVDDKVDVDTVVVFVATEAVEPAGHLASRSPADVVTGPVTGNDDGVVLVFTWPDADAPRVSARCAVTEPLDVAIDGDRLTVTVAPSALPCPVVVDAAGSDEGPIDGGDGVVDEDAFAPRVGRSAVTLWPDDGTVTAIARTALALPAPIRPGAVVDVSADVAAGTVVVSADGTDLAPPGGDAPAAGTFRAPAHPGSYTLQAERRETSSSTSSAPSSSAAAPQVSGGVVAVALDVVVGGLARAPTVDGGPDLRVKPGARFRIIAAARDADTVEVVQVLGAPAARVAGFVDVHTAPDESATLLFHVTAVRGGGGGGAVASAPDPVRVVVDPAAENRPPELTLPPIIYTTPGAEFVIDASGARDDAGLITAWEVAQDPDDADIVLATPALEPVVRLTAGEAGERYRFRVSAYDEGSLGTTVEVEVVVEDAGPYVDPDRGADGDGDGSAARPFSTIAAALDTAGRHRFPALLLARGSHVLTGRLPDGLGLAGGYVFADVDDGGNYVVDDAPGASSELVLGSDVFVVGGDLARLTLSGPGALHVEQDVALSDIGGTATIALDDGAQATGVDVDGPGISAFGASFTCAGCALSAMNARGSTLELTSDPAAGLGSVGAVDVDGGLLVLGDAVNAGPIVVGGGANVALLAATVRADGGPALRVGAGAVRFDGTRLEADLPLDLPPDDVDGVANVGVVLAEGSSLRGTVALTVRGGPAAIGVAGPGVVDLVDSVIDVEGDLGFSVASLTLARCVVVVSGAHAVVALPATGPATGGGVDLSASILRSSGVVVEAVAGRLRHVTLISDGAVVQLGPDVVMSSSVLAGERPGVLPTLQGTNGVVVADLDVVCDACVIGPPGSLTDDGHLSDLEPHPFVDAAEDADDEDAVALDVDGEQLPQGPAADLGADERTVE